MVYSLISQFSQQCVSVPATIEDLFASCGKGGHRPSLSEALGVLQDLSQSFPQVYLVLDALNECGDRKTLLDGLQSIAAWKLENLHLLVTSKKEHDISNSLTTFIHQEDMICLQSAVIDPDIQTYIRQRLSEDKTLEKWRKDEKIQADIESMLMEGANGM
jgi:hypothetical protein